MTTVRGARWTLLWAILLWTLCRGKRSIVSIVSMTRSPMVTTWHVLDTCSLVVCRDA